jgi:hypothetical protein
MAAQQSEAVATSTRAGQEVSAGARAAIEQAIAVLEAHDAEPRVRALVEKLRAIASPTDNFAAMDYARHDREGLVVKAMVDAERIAKSEAASPAMRERAAAAHRDLQLSHLQRWNPRAAADWQRLHGAA